MHRLSLNRLLHLIMLVPLLALAVFGATIIVGTVRAYRDIETVAALEKLVTAASWLIVGALNDESTQTHPFVASGADRERTAMLTARLVSDEQRLRAERDAHARARTKAVLIGLLAALGAAAAVAAIVSWRQLSSVSRAYGAALQEVSAL